LFLKKKILTSIFGKEVPIICITGNEISQKEETTGTKTSFIFHQFWW
jgi:hypothetical protein